jgi:hypothetical protein
VIYLLDTSALVGACSATRNCRKPGTTRSTPRRSPAATRSAPSSSAARGAAEYDEISGMFADLYPDAAVPKNAGRWVSAVQYRMARAGHHCGASAVDFVAPV